MKNNSKKIIKDKIKIIRNSKKRVFFKDLKTYDYFDFKEKLKSINFVLKCIDQLSNGYIFVLKNSINSKFLDNAKVKLNNTIKNKKPINPEIKTGIKNGFYISNNLSSKGYKTVDKSFYFFSWNKDETGIYKKIIKIYKPLKILNGLGNNEMTNNKPKDGVVERLHIINYPLNSGHISTHYDPINVSICNFGLYATEHGTDYDRGGFFTLDKKKRKIFVDKKIKKTDIVLFFPSLIHGVDKVNKFKLKNSEGRWFFTINLVQSHHSKKRERTIAVKLI
ncbi:hypothetical protein N9431_00340 [bacterium]|nr:hypothetical protein [bacterium]MDB4812337.1 hypothetical protein [Candidatus Pelagibacter sp.]